MLKADQLRPAVVIVEHATPIRMNIVDLVDKAGCRAIETSNVEDALLLLRQLGTFQEFLSISTRLDRWAGFGS